MGLAAIDTPFHHPGPRLLHHSSPENLTQKLPKGVVVPGYESGDAWKLVVEQWERLGATRSWAMIVVMSVMTWWKNLAIGPAQG